MEKGKHKNRGRNRTVLLAVLAALQTAALAACASSPAEIGTQGAAVQGTAQPPTEGAQAAQTAGNAAAGSGDNAAIAAASYCFTVDGHAVAPDMDMSGVLSEIGKEKTYFEAPSCAFQGLDKVYTYEDFEIDTYPQGDRDLISAIILKNDMVETTEGVAIGGTLSDIQSAYGADAKAEGGAVTLTKGKMRLTFIMDGETITSIEYDSEAADA